MIAFPSKCYSGNRNVTEKKDDRETLGTGKDFQRKNYGQSGSAERNTVFAVTLR